MQLGSVSQHAFGLCDVGTLAAKRCNKRISHNKLPAQGRREKQLQQVTLRLQRVCVNVHAHYLYLIFKLSASVVYTYTHTVAQPHKVFLKRKPSRQLGALDLTVTDCECIRL